MNIQTAPSITVAEFEDLLDQGAPFTRMFGFQVDRIDRGTARVIMPFKEEFVRPGGTISGPAIMSLADFTMYAVVLGMIGPVELAVTTNLNVNFLRRPPPGPLIADGRMMKLGKRLAVVEVNVAGEDDGGPIAHVTGTYSIPPTDRRR